MADEYRRYNNKREIIKLDLVQEADYTDNVVVCVPKFSYDVARALLLHYGKYRTSYAIEYGELFYKLPGDVEFDVIEASLDKFLGSRDMSCDLVTALNNINATIKNQACCGTAGSGQMINDQFYYGSETPLDAPATFGGSEDDFATEVAYNDHRCSAANAIVDGLIYGLGSWSLLTLGALTAGAIAVGLAAIFLTPPVAAFLALAAEGIAFGVLATIANAIDDDRETLVCLLYNSETAVSAYDNLNGYIDDLVVDLGFIEIEVSLLVALVMQFAPIDTMNALYGAVGLPAVASPVDCDACGTECFPYITYGTGDVLVEGVASTITSVWVAGPNKWYIGFSKPAECDCVDYTITITNCTRSNGWTGGSVGNCATQNLWLYTSQTNPNGVYTGAYIDSLSAAAGSFSMDVKIEAI